jgi:hypothetical protein
MSEHLKQPNFNFNVCPLSRLHYTVTISIGIVIGILDKADIYLYTFISPLPAKAEGDYSFRFRPSVRHIKILSCPDFFLTSFDILT